MALEGAGTGNPAGPRWPANKQGICFAEARGETRLRTCVRRLRGDRPDGLHALCPNQRQGTDAHMRRVLRVPQKAGAGNPGGPRWPPDTTGGCCLA